MMSDDELLWVATPHGYFVNILKVHVDAREGDHVTNAWMTSWRACI